MKKSQCGHRFFLGLMLLIVGLSTIASFPTRANKSTKGLSLSQNQEMPRSRPEKYIGRYVSFPNEPILITDLTINGARHQINRKISAGDDWLNGFTFSVKNISNKDIVFIYASLMFPETKAITGNIFAFDLRYGADPKIGTPEIMEKPVEPEKEVKFVLSDNRYRNLMRAIETTVTPIQNINSVQIDILKVIFSDDTAWATGTYMHRDPDNPRKWIDDK